jgi:hypothetical protein
VSPNEERDGKPEAMSIAEAEATAVGEKRKRNEEKD